MTIDQVSRSGAEANTAAPSAMVEGARDLTRLLADDAAFGAVSGALRAGDAGAIDGAWGSSKALALASLLASDPSMLVVVVPHASDVAPMMADLRTLAGQAVGEFPTVEDFGATGSDAGRGMGESFGRRLAMLKAIAGPDPPKLLIATIQALLQPVPRLERIRSRSRELRQGGPLEVDSFLEWLVAEGWERRDAVETPGEFSLRGGILDLFAWDATDPLRIELFGDRVESIREFSIESQRSLREIERAELTALAPDTIGPLLDARQDATGHLAEALPSDAWIALVEPYDLKEEGQQYAHRLEDPKGLFSVDACWRRLVEHPTVTLTSLPFTSAETTCTLQMESVERFSGDSAAIREELDQTVGADHLIVVCHNSAEAHRLEQVLHDTTIARERRLTLCIGSLSAGFRWVSAGLVAISDHQLFQRSDVRRAGPGRRTQGRAIDGFVDLQPGDYVVHLGHGIGIYRGLRMLDKNGQLEEHLTIEFADRCLVYVPGSKIELVQKYVGASQTRPRLAKIGRPSWDRSKRKVEQAVQDLACDLIDIHAARQTRPGVAFPPDSEWQRDFEAAFPFQETDDQLTSMDEIRRDLEAARPMDRLLCGDVGYGKTELAMRAAFKTVDFGKQVAVLAPTTVLAQQHLRTFRERIAEFPFVVECLSRFETAREQRDILRRLATGGVDILIGTHRMLSKDVTFQDLGLIVVDEEQRFGVSHKERLKRLREEVEVLTMTATPIPRTLHSALLGIRDISNLETPPHDRLAIETRIGRFDETLVRHAILRELNRDGQVYFVHNRVKDIHRLADRLRGIVPEARIAVIHGQMHEHEIEEGMLAFIERRADLLLATTIIESGLDIPNANTIFIHEGDRYGLADLHQLRGRVGRSTTRAYCQVLIDEHKIIKPDAQRRLKALEEYSALGAGFKIALRDLEIRGAGNILGAEQSGHIAAVGYELYCMLLENAVRALRKEPLRTLLDVTIELPWKAYFPHDYLPGERFRIDAYRRLARVRTLDELLEFRRDLEDRFGPIPQLAANLLELAELRILAHLWQIESIRPDPQGYLVLSYRNASRIGTLAKMRKGALIVADQLVAVVHVPKDRRDARSYRAILKRVLQPS